MALGRKTILLGKLNFISMPLWYWNTEFQVEPKRNYFIGKVDRLIICLDKLCKLQARYLSQVCFFVFCFLLFLTFHYFSLCLVFILFWVSLIWIHFTAGPKLFFHLSFVQIYGCVCLNFNHFFNYFSCHFLLDYNLNFIQFPTVTILPTLGNHCSVPTTSSLQFLLITFLL